MVSTIATDTMLRGDQSGLGTASDGQSYTLNGGIATSIVSNEAVITGSGGFLSVFLGTKTTADINFLVRLTQNSNPFDGIGPCFRAVDASNMYIIALYSGLGGLVFAKLVSGGFNNIADANITLNNGEYRWIRAQMIGNHVQIRSWVDGGSEPGTWDIDTTDSSYASAGRFGMATNAFAGGGDTVSFDHITVTDTKASTGSNLLTRGHRLGRILP